MVIAVSFTLLVVLFRSLVIPLTAALMNLLSVGAAFGILTFVFAEGNLVGLVGLDGPVPIESFVPLMLFAILFGLSMDYEVFLVSSIAERWHATRDPTDAVVSGLGSAGRVVTAAALIMFSVFLSFAGQDDPVIKMFGVGLALAVLLDAVVVRGFLVPGLMVLLGRSSWWLPRVARARAAHDRPRERAGPRTGTGQQRRQGDGRRMSTLRQRWPWLAGGVGALIAFALVAFIAFQSFWMGYLTDGRLESADYWTDSPEILSAGFGFDGIIGIESLDEAGVRAAGGSWYRSLTCTNGEEPAVSNRTSASRSGNLDVLFEVRDGASIDDVDGTPIVFSWPVATETVDPTDFQFTLNTGEVRIAASAGMIPNWELSERNTVVVFDDLGNRGGKDDPDGRFIVRLDVVEDDTPLTLVGPDGDVSAVGLSWETDQSAYDEGPVLVGAKLNRVDPEPAGEGGVPFFGGAYLPNDEHALYDEGDFRLRMLTSGGFSEDGVTGVKPDDFETFFRIHATGRDGEPVLLTETGTEYEVEGGTLRVVGLSDLGQVEDPDAGVHYDDCYVEDKDNYIDVIIVGDEAAARGITHLEIPALDGGYSAFYNPGGPDRSRSPRSPTTLPGPPTCSRWSSPWTTRCGSTGEPTRFATRAVGAAGGSARPGDGRAGAGPRAPARRGQRCGPGGAGGRQRRQRRRRVPVRRGRRHAGPLRPPADRRRVHPAVAYGSGRARGGPVCCDPCSGSGEAVDLGHARRWRTGRGAAPAGVAIAGRSPRRPSGPYT